MKKKIFIIGFVFMVSVLLILCGSFNQAFAAKELKHIKILATSIGGTWYQLALALATEIEKVRPGIKAVGAPGGSGTNNIKVSEGQAEFGLTFVPTAHEAWHGLPPLFKEKYRNFRHVGGYATYGMELIVRKGVKIEDGKIPRDLPSKRFSVGKRTWGSTQYALKALAALGVTPEKVKASGGTIHYLGYDDLTAQFQDRNIDAFVFIGTVPNPVVLNLVEKPGITMPGFTGEQAGAMQAALEPRHLFYRTTVPDNPYPGVGKGYETVGYLASVICHKDMPDDLVYDITKILYEKQSVKDVFKGIEGALELKYALSGIQGGDIPIHPGALKYFREAGLIK
jgi:TRAP transporter TAXI family solute receptor